MVAFDVSKKTFRNKIYPEYKAQRSETPPELLEQFEPLKEFLTALNIKNIGIENYEADDILATLSKLSQNEKLSDLILTGDRDSFQLISDSVKILYPQKNGEAKLMGDEEVYEKYQVHANEYADLAALVGETSDNIKGVEKVGPKTAAKWIQEYGNLDDILKNADKISGQVGENLRKSIDLVKLNREINTLKQDLTLPYQIDDLKINLSPQPDVENIIKELNFGLKIQNELFSVWKPDFKVSNQQQIINYAAKGNKSTHAFSSSDTKNSEKKISNDPPKKSPQSNPTPQKPSEPLTQSQINNTLALKAYIINSETKSFDLDSLLALYQKKDEADLNNYFDQVIKERNQEKLLQLQIDLAKVLESMHNYGLKIDTQILKSLSSNYSTQAQNDEQQIYQIIGHEINLNSPKQLQTLLYDDLHLNQNVDDLKKNSTGFSTDNESLNKIQTQNPSKVVELLLDYRSQTKLAQMITTLIESVSSDGKIHSLFSITGTSTGRIASSNPNLQNIPVITEDSSKIRSAFIPDNGISDKSSKQNFDLFLDVDYSQIELRLLAHLSGDEGLISAFNSNQDIHSAVASEVFDRPADQITPEMRRKAKAINYGIAYGMSVFGLSQTLDIKSPEAKALMEMYFEKYPKVKTYLNQVVAEATQNGYTETILGRRRYLANLTSSNYHVRTAAQRMAMNAPIQGSAADLIELAMVQTQKEIATKKLNSQLILQIHDELLLQTNDSEKDELEKMVIQIMTSVYKLKVPLEVNSGIGSNWQTAAH